MTTPPPATRSEAPDGPAKRVSRRQVVLWVVFSAILIAGLYLAARYGSSVTGLIDQVN